MIIIIMIIIFIMIIIMIIIIMMIIMILMITMMIIMIIMSSLFMMAPVFYLMEADQGGEELFARAGLENQSFHDFYFQILSFFLGSSQSSEDG